MARSIIVESVPFYLKELEVLKMDWKPTTLLIEGMLDNTTPGKVTGWMKFAGMKEKVTFDLEGNFHRDIRGAKIRLIGGATDNEPGTEDYLQGLASHQTGKVGNITAGMPPVDYVSGSVYVEWYSQLNGRVVLELEQDQIEFLSMPIPACESDPISREDQNRNMAEFLGSLAQEMNILGERAVCIGGDTVVKADKRAANNKIRGMKLLTEEIRKKLPPLYSQDGKGGKAIAYVKFFTPDSGFTFWASEFDGKDTFFGLVDGHCKEFGYFSLSELESVRGPMGLPIERDLYFHPKKLDEIAPEMFRKEGQK
jgi:hypothetical protein